MLAARLPSLWPVRRALAAFEGGSALDVGHPPTPASRTQACTPAASAAAAAGTGWRLFSDHAAGQPLDRILLRGLVFHGYHGVYPEVRRMWRAGSPPEHRLLLPYRRLGASLCCQAALCPTAARWLAACAGEQAGAEVCGGCHAAGRPVPCGAQRRPAPHRQLCTSVRVSGGWAWGLHGLAGRVPADCSAADHRCAMATGTHAQTLECRLAVPPLPRPAGTSVGLWRARRSS